MRRVFENLLLAAALCLSAAAVDAVQPVPESGTPEQRLPASGKPLFSEPIVLRGTLGTEPVQANWRAKANADEGFEGDYVVSGRPRKTLLAGEINGGEDVFMEESVNGKDVSGQWSGKLKGDVFSGTWQSADGLMTKPFKMKIVRSGRMAATQVHQ